MTRTSNKWIYKYLVKVEGEELGKFRSINEFLKAHGEVLNLNRQKCYRLRKGQYSTKSGTSAHALEKKGYNKIEIIDIREHIKSRLVRVFENRDDMIRDYDFVSLYPNN